MSIKLEMGALIRELNRHTELYDKGTPEISDKEWDDAYFKLAELERKYGIVLQGSPTQSISYTVVNELQKVKHSHPMLSLDKTKDTKVVKSFLKDSPYIAMAKLDGLTCSLTYVKGKLVMAETRGNGIEGEDITHNMLLNSSVPNYINTNEERFVIDGEIVCSYSNFERFKDKYKNPRNFASGSARLLDGKESADRGVVFIAWDIVEGFEGIETLSRKLQRANDFFGFLTVPRTWNKKIENVEEIVNLIKDNCPDLPIDGVVFKFDNIEEYNACGRTDHHFKGGLAYKFYDETYPTRLRSIRWTMGRTGAITPTAVFDPIEIDGTIVEKASLHNINIMRELLGECAYVGEPLEIYKANQIIPQVYSAGPHYNYGEVIAAGGVSAHDVIEKCPICGSYDLTLKNGVLYCDNPNCEGKFINQLDHFLGKKGLDIKGLSKKTLEKLVDWGWIESFEDVFELKEYREEWIKQSGFGPKSVDKILDAIEKGRTPKLSQFISSIGIRNISTTASIMLADYFKTWEAFRKAVNEGFDFTHLPHFGTIADYDIGNFDYSVADNLVEKYISFEANGGAAAAAGSDLEGLTFVITGKVHQYKNRDELKSYIESLGGKVAGSVSSKTDYLINNDVNSTTQKNQKARSLGVPIISEEEFMALIKHNIENK